MNIFPTLSSVTLPKAVRGLTIGNFDGVHLGHRALLNQLRTALPQGGQSVVYTFSNHPSHILSHLAPIPYICTLEHKLKLLHAAGVDATVLVPFSLELARTPFDRFLETLKETLDFSVLVLGTDARFGKNREGNPEKTRQLGKTLGFEVIYVPKYMRSDQVVSSALIRTRIAQGDLDQAAHYLGRPYSIYAEVHHGAMSLKGLCLPPTGIYRATLEAENQLFNVDAHVHRHTERIDGLPHLSAALTELTFPRCDH
jgi:riboflavin kinase/FMN adenylyltransferase